MPEDVCAEDPVIWKQYRDERLKKQVESSRQIK
jgi:hypothetical protein